MDCGKNVFFKNGRFWVLADNGIDCVLLDMSGFRGRDGSGKQGPIGPAGAPGGFVPAVTDASLTGDGSALDPLGLPYKIYVALLNQEGVDAPVATVLQNTIGPIVWSRTGVGRYNATLAGAFTSAKTVLFIGQEGGNGAPILRMFQRVNDNVLRLETYSDFSTIGDDLLSNASVEIRVYP